MTSTASRKRLPDRRPNRTETIQWAGQKFAVSIGFWPDSGHPAEIFIDGAKAGSDLRAILADTSVLLSLCLQYGIEPSALLHSMGRVPVSETESAPASIIGTICEALAQEPDAKKAATAE